MSFDQPVYSFSYPGGEPPTPIRTPTSPLFSLNSFETPKQELRFQDARSPWGTAFANALSPSFKTPSFPAFSPTTPTGRGNWSGKDLEAEIATHPHTSLHPDSSLPLEKSDEPSAFTPIAFPDFDTRQAEASDFPATKAGDGMATSVEAAVSSAGSMQTPPPTSTSASRRKAQQGHAARQAKGSVGTGDRRLSSPSIVPESQPIIRHTQREESPANLSTLQFSPDGFGFPISGPATAPVYPQHKLFWDQDQISGTMNIDLSMDDTFTAFGIGANKNLDSLISNNNDSQMLPFTTSPAFSAVETSAGMSRSSHAPALNQTNISPSTAVITQGSSRVKHPGTVVNPSLLFSSPSRVLEKSGMPSSIQPAKDEILQPYAHQIRDAQIEKEIKNRKQKRKRVPETGDSPAVKAAVEALREDGVDVAGSSPVVAESFVGALPDGRPTSSHDMPTRKRVTPESHYRRRGGQSNSQRRKSDKIPAKRTAVTLKIDSSGRAVTETTIVSDRASSSTGNKMDIDSTSGDSEINSSSMDEKMVINQQQSFDPRPRRQQTKKVCLADSHRAHSQKSSNASTLATTISGATLQGMRARGHLVTKGGHAQAHFPPSQWSQGGGDGDESEAETIVDSDEDNGDAQSELKRVVRGRTLKRANKRHSWSASKPYSSTAPGLNPYYTTRNISPSPLAYHKPPSNISPSTLTDPCQTTPNSGRESNISGDSTRCVCNVADGNGQLMVQCESCRKWLHTSCVGLSSHNLPGVYLCTFCTESPRAVRGGRVPREPGRTGLLRAGSPLAHKSHRFR